MAQPQCYVLRSLIHDRTGGLVRAAAMTTKDSKTHATTQDQRKARLAAELRANLLKRKAQARSRRTGAADERPDGIAAAGKDDPA